MRQLVILGLQVSIMCTVFAVGLKATAQDLLYVVHRPVLLWRSLFCVFVVVPALAIAGARLLDLKHTAEVALIAWAISPLPPLLPKKEIKAGGQQSYALGLLATLAILSIVFVPVAMQLLARLYDRRFAVPPGRLASIVMISTVIPLVAGIAVRAVSPRVADRIGKPVGSLARWLLILAAVALILAAWEAIWGATGGGTLLVFAIFVAASLLAGHVIGGPQPDHSVVLALSSAGRHPGIALAIASTNYPEERFGGTILLFFIVSAIVAVPYLAWQRRHAVAMSVSPA